ncbi:hypothetical protein B0H16DRAFT_241114 [Mycena metata]|uniref:DUF6535 domain-containing protein n=1 Tax=Mycena metata TaxID=1033252 RepID=A0AAD7HVV0_9AGAR|nr:hypothetical protein B0H16DRAFT_241114 [Mycena metata]
MADEEHPLPNDPDEAAGAKLWSVYISEAEKYDKALVESWKSDMEGILIFAGLFSAILTAFLIESYKTLSPDAGATTVVLLTQISLQLSGISNGSSIEIPTSPPFAAPMSSLVCNALWFVSLGLSLSCALIATLVEQWAREFQHKAEMRSAPIIRARIFTYLYYGLKRFHMHLVVDLIPLLLHASLIIFFAGLVAFLVPVNRGIMVLSAFILALVVLVYSVLTVLPLLYFDCPYRTPLSGVLWRGIRNMRLLLPPRTTDAVPILNISDPSMIDVMSRLAIRRSGYRDERDYRALCWTVRSLADDEELEPFIEGVPDVLWSSNGRRTRYDEHLRVLLHDPEVQLLHRVENFLRTSDSDLLSPDTQSRRRIAALKAVWAITTMPRRDGRFLEPLESFDATLLAQSILPFKIAYYQVSTRTVVNLNFLLSVSGDIHDATQVAVVLDALAKDAVYPPINQLSLLLPPILSKLDRLAQDLWQSSADREHRDNLLDLRDHPPTSPLEQAEWITQCVITFNSLPTVLQALEYEIFVAYMIDSAALESWPYEFEATRATFSFDESAVSADMAGMFSTAFDSIVSEQSRRARYSTHADEILAILLAICAASFSDDITYFPLNLTTYLRNQEDLAVSQVAQKCNTLWLSSCLTTELIGRERESALLTGPVVEAIWHVAFLMARQYLDSYSYHSTPSVHGRTLESIRKAAPSNASWSAIAVTQTNILNALSPTPSDFDNLEASNTVLVHLILSEHKSTPATPGETTPPPVSDAGPRLSILTMRVIILANFIQRCTAGPAEIPFNAARTIEILTAFTPGPPGVHAEHQMLFSRSWSAAFAAEDTPVELLQAMANGELLSVYSGGSREWAHRWLDDVFAIQIFTESISTYLHRVTETNALTRKLGIIQRAFNQID